VLLPFNDFFSEAKQPLLRLLMAALFFVNDEPPRGVWPWRRLDHLCQFTPDRNSHFSCLQRVSCGSISKRLLSLALLEFPPPVSNVFLSTPSYGPFFRESYPFFFGKILAGLSSGYCFLFSLQPSPPINTFFFPKGISSIWSQFDLPFFFIIMPRPLSSNIILLDLVPVLLQMTWSIGESPWKKTGHSE